jgi:TonB family protein
MNGTTLLILAILSSITHAQTPPQQSTVRPMKLAATGYPNMARLAHIAGTVELNVVVRPDGSVESVTVVSGHPMLNDTALQSAKATTYECENCSHAVPHRMTYKFELGNAVYCKGIDAKGHGVYDAPSYQHVTLSGDLVIVFDRPFGTCDPIVQTSTTFKKTRSAKCLYLWHCGSSPL